MTSAKATMRVIVPATLAHVYLKDFGSNYAAAADYAGVNIYTLKRAVQAILIPDEQAAALLAACSKRLGKDIVDRILHPQAQANGTAPAVVGHSAWGPVTVLEPQADAAAEPLPAPLEMKQCITCGKDFAPTLENFARHPHSKDGLQGYCRTCHGAMARTARAVGRQRKAEKEQAGKTAITQAPPAPLPQSVAPAGLALSASLLALAAEAERLEHEAAPLRQQNAHLIALVASLKQENAEMWQQLAALKAG